MSELMEIAAQVYEVWSHICSDRAINGRKVKGGEHNFPTNPDRGRAGKHKKNYAGHPSDQKTGDKTWLVHGLRYCTEECKVLKEESNKYALQYPHKEDWYGGKSRCGNSIKSYDKTQEVNSMVSHAKPASKKKGVKAEEKY